MAQGSTTVVYTCNHTYMNQAEDYVTQITDELRNNDSDYSTLPFVLTQSGSVTSTSYTSFTVTKIVLNANIKTYNSSWNERTDTGTVRFRTSANAGTIAFSKTITPNSGTRTNYELSNTASVGAKKINDGYGNSVNWGGTKHDHVLWLSITGISGECWDFSTTTDMKLTITLSYSYTEPSINEFESFSVSNTGGNSCRKLKFKYETVSWVKGQNPTGDKTTYSNVVYTIYDKNNSSKILYTNTETSTAAGTEKEVTMLVPRYCQSNEVATYQIKAQLGGKGSDKTKDASPFTPPYAPQWHNSLQKATLSIPNMDSESEQDMLQAGGVLTGDSVYIQWGKPEIYYASELYVNFEILWSKDNGRTFESLDKLFKTKAACPQVTKDTTQLNDTGIDTETGLYTYILTKDKIQNDLKIANYQRIYLAVRPIITADFNSGLTWDTGTTQTFAASQSTMIPDPDQDAWTDFICVYECNVQYCPDGFRWVKCLVYYCEDGTKWTPIVARWSPTGSNWVYC